MPSQYNESILIAELLSKPLGVYVDIGAGDPWDLSNTGDLYRLGWRGLLIEPLIERCQLLARQRPRDVVVNKAASNRIGELALYVDGDLSSLNPTWHGSKNEQRLVNADTLSNILLPHLDIRNHCDLCSIDVEGHELEVLQGLDFSTFRPELFLIESLIHGSCLPSWPNWEPILTEQSYEFVVASDYGLNRFYRRTRRSTCQP